MRQVWSPYGAFSSRKCSWSQQRLCPARLIAYSGACSAEAVRVGAAPPESIKLASHRAGCRRFIGLASSTKRHKALTGRMSSIERQRISSSFGDATSTASACACEIATFSRFGLGSSDARGPWVHIQAGRAQAQSLTRDGVRPQRLGRRLPARRDGTLTRQIGERFQGSGPL